MNNRQTKGFGVLVILLGVIMSIGVGIFSRPMVKPRPVVLADGTIRRDASGVVVYEKETVRSVNRMMRPYDAAAFAGLAIAVGGAIVFLKRRGRIAEPRPGPAR